MKTTSRPSIDNRLIKVIAGFSGLFAVLNGVGTAHAQSANLTDSGYYQNFSSLGTGTSLATSTSEWTYWSASGEHSWGTGGVIPVTGTPSVATMTQVNQSTTPMTVVSGLPSGTNDNAFNAPLSAVQSGAPAGTRVIATSPTGDAGVGWQLTLTNETGAALTSINLSYDIVELAAGTDAGTARAEAAPGYQLFYSTNGSTWTNVAAANPQPTSASGPSVPNSVGVTPVSLFDVTLASAVAEGSNLELRWVDPNDTDDSPDEIIGLTDVSVAPVPLPPSVWMFGSALLGVVTMRRRKFPGVGALA